MSVSPFASEAHNQENARWVGLAKQKVSGQHVPKLSGGRLSEQGKRQAARELAKGRRDATPYCALQSSVLVRLNATIIYGYPNSIFQHLWWQ